jgi:outer membrane protein TolC
MRIENASRAGRAVETPLAFARAAFALTATLLWTAPVGADPALPLARALELAQARDPLAAGFAARRDAALARAAERAALPDPTLSIGVENLPTGDLALDAEDMTMVSVALRQPLPAWGRRAAERSAAERGADAERAAGAERAAALRRMVRERFAMVAAAGALDAAIEAELPRARAALDAAQAAYAAGATPQSDVAEARLWLAELLESRLRARSDAAVARAGLVELVGPAGAGALGDAEPGPVAPLAELRAALPEHPALAMDAERAAAAEAEAAAARAARRPEWMLDLRYGVRSGTGMGGAPRDDMVSAMLGMSLPFGARSRGAERAASAEARAVAAERDDRARELGAALEAAAARHAALLEIEVLYAAAAAPAAALNETAQLRDFSAARAGYAALARAQRMRFDTERRRIAITAERRAVAAELLYLDGRQP